LSIVTSPNALARSTVNGVRADPISFFLIQHLDVQCPNSASPHDDGVAPKVSNVAALAENPASLKKVARFWLNARPASDSRGVHTLEEFAPHFLEAFIDSITNISETRLFWTNNQIGIWSSTSRARMRSTKPGEAALFPDR
jgi:hypothetical protein